MKRYVIAAIFAFCLIIPLFLAIPTRSNPAVGEYDPWADINDDGKIDMRDISYIARMFGVSGTPINKTELLLELQSKIDSLNSSLLNLEAYLTTRITTLEATVAQQQSTITNLETELAVLNATKLGQPDYDSGWIDLPIGQNTYLTHNLNTTRVLVYLTGKGIWGIHQVFYGLDRENEYQGACWGFLDETRIDIYRGTEDDYWTQARVMMWIIP